MTPFGTPVSKPILLRANNDKATALMEQMEKDRAANEAVALAALESGVINQNDKVFCPGHMEFGEKKFHCWNEFGHGNINVVKALARSCDVFFYQIALKTGRPKP